VIDLSSDLIQNR